MELDSIVGPEEYCVAFQRLESNGYEAHNINGVLEALSDFFLHHEREPIKRDQVSIKRKDIRKRGVWAHTVTYWKGDFIYIKNDIFGNRTRLSPTQPPNPEWVIEKKDWPFGYYDVPTDLLNTKAVKFLGERTARKLVDLAKYEGVGIRLVGLADRSPGTILRVCSVSFSQREELQVNFADTPYSLRYALGKEAEEGPGLRFFNQP